MDKTVLVGSTGFVGTNLAQSHRFDAEYHSTNIETAFERENGLVVYSGVPSAMFLANRDPEADLAVMRAARENMRKMKPQRLVLISSIAVYADSRGKNEKDEPDEEGLAPYGANRLQLERWVREDHPDALIVRLPALYGAALKKNFLFDLHTVTPALLKPEKYEELSAKSSLVKEGYSDAGKGFYKLNGKTDAKLLRQWFSQNDWNALQFTDSRSVYQFYNLGRLWQDIEAALLADLRVLNLATPPVSAAQVHEAVTGRPFVNETADKPFDYDLRTLHADILGGGGGYLCSREEELSDICQFMKKWEEEA